MKIDIKVTDIENFEILFIFRFCINTIHIFYINEKII